MIGNTADSNKVKNSKTFGYIVLQTFNNGQFTPSTYSENIALSKKFWAEYDYVRKSDTVTAFANAEVDNKDCAATAS